VCGPYPLTRRDADDAGRAVAGIDGAGRHEPAQLAPWKPQFLGVVFVYGRNRHGLHRLSAPAMAAAMRDGVSPNASISSS
jgi:hypothetical protein